MIVADTSGLLALFNRGEPQHAAVRDLVAATSDRLAVSPYVLAELDYLVGSRIGVDAELAVLAELAGGAYVLADIGPDDLHRGPPGDRALPRPGDRAHRCVAGRPRRSLGDAASC